MTNQLQKDIQTALTWFKALPFEQTHGNTKDVQAHNRLKQYSKGDYDYCKMEMRTLLENAYENERTSIGKNTIRQLLEAIQ